MASPITRTTHRFFKKITHALCTFSNRRHRHYNFRRRKHKLYLATKHNKKEKLWSSNKKYNCGSPLEQKKNPRGFPQLQNQYMGAFLTRHSLPMQIRTNYNFPIYEIAISSKVNYIFNNLKYIVAYKLWLSFFLYTFTKVQ